MDSIRDHKQHSASTPCNLFERGTQWSSLDDNSSVSSRDSRRSKFGSFFKRAKAKGKKLVHRRKKKHSETVMIDQTHQTDVDLAETVDGSMPVPNISFIVPNDTEVDIPSLATDSFDQCASTSPLPTSQSSQAFFDSPEISCQRIEASVKRKIPFLKSRIVVGLCLLVLTLLLPYWLVSFFWGVYVTVVAFLYLFVSKPVANPIGKLTTEMLHYITTEVNRRKARKETITYRGWMNELRRRYEPSTHSVNMTQSVLVELKGRTLRIARPKRNVFKHTFFNDPTLTDPEPAMVRHRTYDLTDAYVSLRPHGLARRRWWNRKYPIFILLAPQDHLLTVGEDDQSESEFSLSDNECFDDKPVSEVSKVRRRWTISKSTNDLSVPMGNRRRLSHGSLFRSDQAKFVARGKRIILFARSSREKERWFHRLRKACSTNRTVADPTLNDEKRASNLSMPALVDQSIIRSAADVNVDIEYYLYVSNRVQFARTMAEIMKSSSIEHWPDNGVIHIDLDRCHWTPKAGDFKSEIALAANAVVARLFFDFCRDERWIRALPHFIETLTLAQLELGTTVPQVLGVHAPVLNDWGLWIDVEVKYDGGLQLGLETKIDLKTMMEPKHDSFRKVSLSRPLSNTQRRYSDDDLSCSPETSADEDFGGRSKTPDIAAGDQTSGGMGKTILSVIDKVTKSYLFHEAAELGPIKKVLEEISSTRLMLNVEVTLLEGTLAFNIPPPPSDRLWYGFRRPPKLTLKAVPQVGDRTVDLSTVSNWIETRLHVLLEKNLVVPNMTDLIIPLMSGNEMLKFGYSN